MDAQARLSSLSAEIALKYGVSGSLEKQVRKIGGTLPRYERARAKDLVRVAEALERDADQIEIDERAFEVAEMALQMHLEHVDAEAFRKSVAVDVATTILVNLVLGAVALAVVWFLVV